MSTPTWAGRQLMLVTDRDLTSSQSWNRLWRAYQSKGLLDPLKARLGASREFDDILERLLSTVGVDSCDVLEIGCAPGAVLERVHRLRPQHRLHGIDSSSAGVVIARQRLCGAHFSATIHEGDARTIDLKPVYPLVLSCGLIEHFDDPREILECHRRLVADGGVVAVTVPNYSHSFVRRMLELFSPETLATHNLQLMDQHALRSALEGLGLIDVCVGSGGRPILPNSRPRAGLLGMGYRLAARSWNVSTALLPFDDFLWPAYIWAYGRAPVR